MKKAQIFLMFTILYVFAKGAFADEKTPVLENCHLDGIRSQIKCGSLSVPENYNKPEDNHIVINYAVLPAIDSSSNNTPLMFLAGGPGQAAVELAAHIRQSFAEIRKTRDIILIDQRGTGLSQPMLCDEPEQKTPYGLIPEEFSLQETLNCIEKLKKTNELSQYNSDNAIRDFEAVRENLGYQQVHLYGGSYGTRAALVYMRLFPQSVKSTILDSVGPIEVPIGLFGKSAERSFNLLLKHCLNDESCNNAYPNLQQEFNTVIQRLSKKIVSLKINHPRLGTQTQFKLSKDKFVNIILRQLYGMETRSMVPLIIHQAFLNNYQPLIGLISANENAMQMYVGLTFNIICNEDLPKMTKKMQMQDSNNNFDGGSSLKNMKAVCDLWPKYSVDDSFYQPVTANIPTLILSGDLDPVTPPSNGEHSANSLPNSHHIIVKNNAHIVASTRCGINMVNDFLNQGDAKKIDQSCLLDLPAESFMTSLNGNI